MKKTVIIALGGNALSPKKESGTIQQQFRHTRESLKAVMHFVKLNYNICITHGNGPQVGAELSKNEIAMDIIPPLPLNILVANTQGAIGYMIQQSLQNALYNENTDREVVSFISQIKVDRKDPAINKTLNKKLGRTEFMPFAPATLEESAESCFDDLAGGRQAAYFMTMTFNCTRQMKDEAPATVHVDGTARPQIVSPVRHKQLYEIVDGYRRRTGRSSVINTSFNLHEEPIVCTINDALRALTASRLPYLAAGNFLVETNEEILQ